MIVQTSEPYQGQQEWRGQLIRRDESGVYLNLKGRSFAIPRQLVSRVKLDDGG